MSTILKTVINRLRQHGFMLFILLVVITFLIELYAPSIAFVEIGYLTSIIYILRYPQEGKKGILLISITSLLIITGLIFHNRHITPDSKMNMLMTHVFGISLLWLVVYFNNLYAKTLLSERRLKEQLQSIFNHATQGILVVDQSQTIILINPTAEKLLGYEPNELVGEQLNVLVSKSKRSDHLQKMAQFHAHPEVRQMGNGLQTKAIRKDGKELPVDVSLSHYKNKDGSFVIAFLQDLTERYMQQKKIEQERNLADTYFDMAPALFLVMDHTGKVLAINNYGCELLGYNKNEIIGKNWFTNFLPDETLTEGLKQFNSTRFGLMDDAGQHPILTASGEEIEMNWQHVARKIGDEAVILCSGTDISAQRKQERLMEAHHHAIISMNEELERKVNLRTQELEVIIQQLRHSNRELDRNKQMLQTTINHFPDGIICVLDKDMRYIIAGGQELNALGLHQSIDNKQIFNDVHPALSYASEEQLRPVFHGHHISYDLTIDTKIYHVNAIPIRQDNGEITEIMVVINNITEEVQLKEKLRQAVEKERELTSMKSKFVTMASHEFRTPLATIASSSFLLKNYTGEDYENRKARHLEKIDQSVTNMTNLLNDFILLGKLEEGKVKVSPSLIDLNELQESFESELEVLKKNNQKLSWKFIGDHTVVVLDKQLLKSVLMNLISNALKYSSADDEVKVIVHTTEKEVKFQIIDQGIGIPSEDQSHIFKRFFRAQNSTNIGGTGLGLNIARKHVKLMNGRIEFKSKLNEGTTFTVTIPLLPISIESKNIKHQVV